MKRGREPTTEGKARGAGAQGVFIGREADLAGLVAAFEAGARVVTLVGPGGIGKTRCARELAARLAPARFVFCDLSSARSADDVATAVCEALGVAPGSRPNDDSPSRVAAAITAAGSPALLLDNFEHLTSAAPATIGAWLPSAPHARFLVTSRERLHLAAETVWELSALALPGPADDPRESDAVRLLLERSDRARADRATPPDELAVATDIARRLDGIPLALELAAPRIGALGARTVRDLLAQRGDVLGRGPADGVARHHTMRAAIDWSWTLLDASERALLARASCFRGGFDLEALSACSLPEGSPHAALLLSTSDVLQRLVEKSMVRRIADGTPDARFDLYEVIRDYADERLRDDGVAADVEARHAAYYVARAEARSAMCYRDGGQAALMALRADQENLHAVVERAIQRRGASLSDAVRALVALHPVVAHLGALDAQLARWDAVLATEDAALQPSMRARGLLARGRLLGRSGRAVAARRDLEIAATMAEAAGEASVAGQALTELGLALHASGDKPLAYAALDRALDLLGRCGDLLLEGLAHRARGSLQTEDGRSHDAIASFERALTCIRATEMTGFIAPTLVNLGIARLAAGELGRARHDLEQSLALRARGSALPGAEWVARGALGRLDLIEGRLSSAEDHFAAAIAQARAVGYKRFEGLYLGFAALARAERGEVEAAREQLRASIARLDEASERTYAALFSSFEAILALAQGGSKSDAARLEAACDALAAASLTEVARTQRAHGRARELMGGATAVGPDASVMAARARAMLVEVTARSGAREPGDADLAISRRFAGLALSEIGVAPAVVDGGALIVHATGRWFRLPSGQTVDCAPHRTLRRVLSCLAEAAVARPGAVVPTSRLLGSVWPDERATPASRNRLKTLVSKLRKLGLRDHLRSDPDGYFFDGGVAVRLAPDTPGLDDAPPGG